MGTRILALFGSPVSRSPSPEVHGAFAAQFGLDVAYRLIESTAEPFAERLNDFRQAGGSGCNITLPLKQIAFEQADVHTSRATLAMAANTLWWDEEGRCHADITDGEGLVRDLERNIGLGIQGLKVLLLGAGGAAAGVTGAVLERKPAQLVVVNRTLERARELAARHSKLGEVHCLSVDDLERCAAPDLVIDATSIGHSGRSPELPREILDGMPLCYSLNYGEAAQPFIRRFYSAGLRVHDGLGMLVEQAACSFEIWTGHKPDTAPVLADLRASMGSDG